jgi:glutathione S-transferase
VQKGIAMELYHNNMSVCAQRVRLAIHEKGLHPTEHHLNLRTGDQFKPEYLKLNPKGVVPTIVDHGQPIVESNVICEYLDDAYPEPPLRPADPIQRAHMREWTVVPDQGLFPACATVSFAIAFRYQYIERGEAEIAKFLAAKPDDVSRERFRRIIYQEVDAAPVVEALKVHDKILTTMSDQLERTRWLAGDEFTLADIALLPYIVRLDHLSLAWMWEDKRAAVGRWLGRAKARSGFAGIANYVDPKYLSLMGPRGREVRDRVAASLAH